MEAKTFEIRDVATFIPVLAIRLDPDTEADRYLLSRAGFGKSSFSQGQYILLCRINGGGGQCSTDPYDWQGGGTLRQAHIFILAHWEELRSGDVVDVEFLRGDSPAPKVSDRFNMENPL